MKREPDDLGSKTSCMAVTNSSTAAFILLSPSGEWFPAPVERIRGPRAKRGERDIRESGEKNVAGGEDAAL